MGKCAMRSRALALVRSGRTGAMTVVAASLIAGVAAAPSAAAPPDGRGWELVSPADKAGYGVEFFRPLAASAALASESGDRVSYQSFQSFPGGTNPLPTAYVAERGSSGWASTQVSPRPTAEHPFLPTYSMAVTDFTPDLDAAVLLTSEDLDFDDQNAPLSPIVPTWDLYLKRIPGPFQFTGRGPAPRTTLEPTFYTGMSDDARHVLFQTTDRTMAAEDSGRLAGNGLYDRVDGRTITVDVKTDGTLVSACGATIGDSANGTGAPFSTRGAVSADGSQVVFRSPARDASGDPSCDDVGQLYLRADNATTTQISRSRLASPETTRVATFRAAAADGSKIYFTTDERLVDDAPAASSDLLYEYRPADDSLHFVASSVARVLGTTEDGSHAYFLTLSAGTAGSQGFYVAEESGITQLLDTTALPSLDALSNQFDDWSLPTRVSDNGRYFGVITPVNLTDYDALGTNQLYVVDADNPGAGFSCASCPTDGSAPLEAGDERVKFYGGSQAAFQQTQSRNVTNDGSVFFQTLTPLSDGDENLTPDVYEWQNGQTQLISGGARGRTYYLLGSADQGRDVFVVTGDTLVPQDIDNGSIDVYDARVGGGFPVETPPAECDGDSCQGPQTPGVNIPPAGTVTFTGPDDAQDPEKPFAPDRAAPKVKLGKSAVRGSAITLRVKAPAKGKITVTGSSVKSVKKSVKKAGSYRIAVKLTPKAKRALKQKKRLKVRVRVSYVTATGDSSSATVSLTVKA